MQNIRELRASLIANYEAMKDKTMPINTGRELTNTAGKILLSVRMELDYNQFMGTKTPIPFLAPEQEAEWTLEDQDTTVGKAKAEQ